MDKTAKNQMVEKKYFIQLTKQLPKFLQQQKKLILHHDNFRQSL